MTELNVRMSMTKPGQVTWAEPDIGYKCAACIHAVKADAKEIKENDKLAAHRCGLVKLHTGKKGVVFNAYRATACSKFGS
jgi:DNA-directed RNA polymerase subunit RPC12/RpoP